ncbi:hypothetical protein CRUP_035551 [Coryphaenoides rupestris]|nr:hypothetical protein CRUP_035551 [Coryphaenoides rupestris]
MIIITGAVPAAGGGDRERVHAMHPSSIEGVEDMSCLAELHEAAIMHNLHQRYRKDSIYTNIGSILAAVNPYKQIPGMYDPDRVELYSKHHLGELPPHIFAIANECYRCIWKRHDSQCVLISRFGKFIQLHFSEGGNIQGGCVFDCILLLLLNLQSLGGGGALNRVVRQNPGERNYHIFYALLAGATKEHKEQYFLGDPPESFHYLSQSGCLKDKSLNDKELFNSVMRSIILRGEEICSPLTIEQAVDSRDSVAMALYAQCFSWIILKINQKIKGKENFKSIGILDIFGFENFAVNRFEQFNINYANEKLQEYFNKHIFSLEQLEYNREGVQWDAIDWMDNAECLDLIEKKLGMLALVNEESRFPKGTDFTLLEKLHSRHAVLYDVRGILEKNRDTFRDDILNMLKDSRLDFIYDLFEKVGSRNNEDTAEDGHPTRRKPTVSSPVQGQDDTPG